MASLLWRRATRPALTVVARSRLSRGTSLNFLIRTEHALATDPSTVAASPSQPPLVPLSALPDKPENPFPLFTSLKGRVSYDTLKAITVRPFQHTHMSAVQAQVLPLLPEIAQPYSEDLPADGAPRPPRDLLVRAKTGTGKTLGFLVPAIEARLNAIQAAAKQAVRDAGLATDKHLEGRTRRTFTRGHVGTLIISPTRELATQIAVEAQKLTTHHDEFQVQLLVGGESRRHQLREWNRGRKDIVVATPGRIRDLLNEETVSQAIANTKILILDEADTLLEMGFREEIEAIKSYLPPTPVRQTFLFSATVSPEIQKIARSTLDKNHIFVNTVTEESSPVHAHVAQYHTVLPSAAEQIPHLLRVIAHDQLVNAGRSKAIVFLPTTKMTQLFSTVLRDLSRSALPAGRQTKIYEIHSKRSQDQRSATSNSFRADISGASILVTSDVSARGVDYPGVSRVIQVGIPAGPEQYIHRVGRTGRQGNDGIRGRGDLILLPWEHGFIRRCLSKVPLKPLTVQQLAGEIEDLAKKYDENPQPFWPTGIHAPLFKGASRQASRAIRPYETPISPQLSATETDRMVAEFISTLDEEAIKDTFASNLGYYMGRGEELDVRSKGEIVNGCKAWTVEAMGMENPPYTSEAFLLKLGYSASRENRNANRGRASFGSRGGSSNFGGSFGSRDQASGNGGGFGNRDSGYGNSGGFSRSRGGEGRENGGGGGGFGSRAAPRPVDNSSSQPHWVGRGSRASNTRRSSKY